MSPRRSLGITLVYLVLLGVTLILPRPYSDLALFVVAVLGAVRGFFQLREFLDPPKTTPPDQKTK